MSKIKNYRITVRPRKNLSKWGRKLLGSRKAKKIIVSGFSKRTVKKAIHPYPYKITKIKRIRRY